MSSHTSVRFSRRALIRIAGLSACGVLLAACQPRVAKETVAAKEAAPTTAAVAKSTEKVDLKWDTFRGAGTPWPDNMINSFRETYPNVSIEFRPIPIPSGQLEAYAKMYTMHAGGTLGDVISFDPSHWEFFRAVKMGLLHPIDDYAAAESFDFSSFYDSFMDLQRFEGKTWGLPTWGHSGVDAFLYNATAFEDDGLPLPDHDSPDFTMDTMYDHAVRVHKTTNDGRVERYGMVLGFNSGGARILTRAFGGDIISEDGKKSALTDPGSAKGIKWAHDLSVKEKVVAIPGGYEGGALDLFVSGKVAMLHTSANTLFTAATRIADTQAVNVKVLLFPKRADGTRPTELRGGSWNIYAQSKHPEWVWEFIKHLTTRHGLLTFLTEGGNQSYVRPDVLEEPFFSENDQFQVWKQNLLVAQPSILPANFRGTEIDQVFSQGFGDLYLGQMGFDQALQNLHNALQRVLDMPLS